MVWFYDVFGFEVMDVGFDGLGDSDTFKTDALDAGCVKGLLNAKLEFRSGRRSFGGGAYLLYGLRVRVLQTVDKMLIRVDITVDKLIFCEIMFADYFAGFAAFVEGHDYTFHFFLDLRFMAFFVELAYVVGVIFGGFILI